MSYLARTHSRVASTLVVALTLTGVGLVSSQPAAASETHSPAVVISQMTGPGSLSNTDTRWAVTGTDLGVMWDNGSGEVLTALGDTFGQWSGPGGGGGDWRSNVLLRSSDVDLSDGMTFDSAVEDVEGHAGEIIPSKKINGDEMTTIPTAGVEVDGRQYLAFMSVKQWGPPGQWDTNFSRIAYSDDNGETWNSTDGPQWTNTADGQHPFQMVSFAKKDGFVFMHGTPNGRLGAVSVARVPESDILDKAAYSYWDGATWVLGDDAAAAPVVPPAAAELSVRYDEHSGKWLMMYLDGNLDVVLRTADAPQGPWSDGQVAASFSDYPGLYGGYIHPWSADGDIYFALSEWDPYNVFLMKIQIDEDGTISNPNLLQDPSFERSSTGSLGQWVCTGNCGIDRNHAWAYSGVKQAYLRYNSGWIDIHQDVPVKPHTTYTFAGYIVTGGVPAEGSLGVRQPGPGGAVLGETSFEQVGRYTRYSVTFDSGDASTVQAFVGTNLNGDRWVQLDDLALVETEAQAPTWELTKTSDPATGGEVSKGDIVTYTVTLDGASAPISGVTVNDELSGVLDDGILLKRGAIDASSGEVTITGTTLTWSGDLEPESTVTITYQVRVKPGRARGDSELVTSASGFAVGAVLLDCDACRTSSLTAVD